MPRGKEATKRHNIRNKKLKVGSSVSREHLRIGAAVRFHAESIDDVTLEDDGFVYKKGNKLCAYTWDLYEGRYRLILDKKLRNEWLKARNKKDKD